MFEVRFHGRGGQGVLMSAHILARTAFLSGWRTQDFAMYGAERRGAPITSFVRWDKAEISERGYIFEPDAVVVLDDTLNFATMLKGLKSRGLVLINSHVEPTWFKKQFKIRRLTVVPATDMALKIIGRPIANAAVLGALVKLLGLPLRTLEKAISTELAEAGHPEAVKKNVLAARECAKLV